MSEESQAGGPVRMDWNQAVSAAKESLSTEQDSEVEAPAVEVQDDETNSANVEDPEPEKAASQDQEDSTADGEELLSEQDLEALRESNPEMAKLAENLERWRAKLTQQSQAQAEERKRYEQYLPAIQEFEKDPAAVIRALAQEHGVNLAEEPTATPTEPDVPLEQRIADALRESLGEELDVLADPLAKPLVDAIQQVVNAVVEERVGPIQNAYNHQQQKEIDSQISEAQKKFEEQYPDWKQHEADMSEAAKKLLFDPEGNLRPTSMSPYETLVTLYKLVTSDDQKKVAEQAQKLIDRQNKAAKAADSASPGVAPQNIRKKPPKNASFAQAAAAAKAGERWASY